MAALDEAMKNRKIAQTLTANNGDDDSDTDSSDTSNEPEATDTTEETDSSKEAPAESAPATQQGPAVQTLADYSSGSAASPTPAPSAADRIGPFTHAIAEDQPSADYVPAPTAVQPAQPETAAAQPTEVPAGHIDLGPPGRNIYTATDTGARYVIDPDTGQMVPHAELATAADKAAQPPGGVEIPKQTVTGVGWSPEEGLPVPQDQVRRAQLVKLPAAVQPAPDTLTQVERGQLVKLPTQPAPDTLSQVEKGIALPPKVQPAGPVTGAPQPVVQAPVQPVTTQPIAGGIQTLADYSGGTYKPQQSAVAQQPVTGALATNPNGSDLPAAMNAVGDKEPAAFIAHHTGGRGTVDGVLSTLKERGLGVEYVMDRDGNIFQTGGPGAQNILAGWGPKGTGLNNQNVIGMEIIAKDDKDVTPAQAAAFARFIAARYPNTPIFGHGEVNPGHKEADEGLTAKNAAQALRAGGQLSAADTTAAAPSAQPITKLKSGFYQDEKPGDFLNGRVTTFATPEDIDSGQDNGVGSPHLGGLDTTQVAGVAIPQAALQQMFGRDWAAAARQARVDVVDPTTGKRLRVPIVDLGPSTDAISDMTPALSQYFGGDKNLSIKIVPKAGPDVLKNPQLFYDEQAAIRNGVDSSTLDPKRQVIAPGGSKFVSVAQTPEQAAAAQQTVQAAVQKQQDLVSALPEVKGGNVIEAYNRLDQGVDGVTPAYIKSAQANLKQEAIAQVRQKYPEIKTDDDAWKVAQTPAWQSTAPITELGTAVYAGYTKADLAFNQMMQGADANRLTDFAHALHPDYKPEGLTAFVKSITDIQDPTQRSQMIGHLMASLPESTQSMFDSVALSDSADRVGNPEYQKAQSEALAAKRAYLDHLEMPDPRMKGGWLEKGAQLVGSVPAMASLWETGAFGQTLFASQIYVDTKDKLQAAHPDWSASQINDTTKNSTIAQLVPQGILAAVGAGQLGRVGELLEQWTGGKINFGGIGRAMEGVENPALRAVIGAAPHVVTGAGAGAAQQIAGNIAEGGWRRAGEGVLGAAVGGAVMGAPAGIAHGIGAAMRPAERPAVVEPPPERPPEPVAGGLSVEDMGLKPNQDNIVNIRAGGLPPEHGYNDRFRISYKDGQYAIETTPFGDPRLGLGETFDSLDQLHQRLNELITQKRWHTLSPEGTYVSPSERLPPVEPPPPRPVTAAEVTGPEVAPSGPVTQEDVARRAYEISQEREATGTPGDHLSDWNQAQKELSQTKEPILPATMSEAEPLTSAIANRYVQERVATGELGQIDPSEGKSTEELVRQGLQMSPNQREGLIDNLVKSKGGDLDQQGAAVRSKEAILSEQSRAASRAADADPTNPQLQAQAKAASDAVTAFYNGPIKKLKQVWSDAGRGMMKEIPLDYTTLNGVKEAYLKSNGQEAPVGLEPKLKQMADAVSKAADTERVAMNNWGKEIENQTRGKTLPNDDQIRARLMEVMPDLPCRN